MKWFHLEELTSINFLPKESGKYVLNWIEKDYQGVFQSSLKKDFQKN